MSMAFSFAPMQVLINDPGTDINASESRALTFWDNTYSEVAPTAATKMRIKGFGPVFTKSKISNVIGVRGNAGQLERLVLNAANFNVAAVIPVNSTIRIAINVNTSNYQGEFARTHDFGSWEYLQVSLVPGDTLATVLAKIYNTIAFSDQARVLRRLIAVDPTTSTGTFLANGMATSVTVLGLNTVELGMFFDIVDGFKVTSAESKELLSPYAQFTGTMAAAVTVAGYEGRNNYQILKNSFLEDETVAYHYHRYERPIPGSLYTSFNFSHAADEEVGGNNIPNQVLNTRAKYTVYLNETICTVSQQQITDFLAGATTINAPVFYSAAQPMVATTAALFKLA